MALKPNVSIDRYQVDFLAELSVASAGALRQVGIVRRYRAGQFVQRRGDPADHALIVLGGHLRSSAHIGA